MIPRTITTAHNTRRSPNVVLMLGVNIDTTLGERLVFAGITTTHNTRDTCAGGGAAEGGGVTAVRWTSQMSPLTGS